VTSWRGNGVSSGNGKGCKKGGGKKSSVRGKDGPELSCCGGVYSGRRETGEQKREEREVLSSTASAKGRD